MSIPIITFEELKNKHDFKEVHYLNIDTEGNELKILQSINFKKTFIHTISVEDNKNEKKVDRLLKKNEFIIIKHSIFDKIFINKNSSFFKKDLYINYVIASMLNIYIGSSIDKLTRPITRKMTFLLKLFK
ncbi:MAG: FkbM family methyltransferase [Candidatus Woesearchaeota archaeon]